VHMMRAADAPSIYTKFLGSSFLSGDANLLLLWPRGDAMAPQLHPTAADRQAVCFTPRSCADLTSTLILNCPVHIFADFTLIICCESAVGEQSRAQLEGAGLQAAAAAEPQQQPGTPDTARSASTAAKSTAGLPADPVSTAAGSAADAAAAGVPEAVPEAAAEGPCSGQDHHGHAEIVPQSPHRAAATAGVGPLSVALLHSSAAHSQQQQTAADLTAGPTAAGQPSALRPIATAVTAAPGVNSSSTHGSTASTMSVRAPAAATTAGHSSISSGSALPGTLSKTLSISSSQTIVMPVHGEGASP
jgi:hypothetical protein